MTINITYKDIPMIVVGESTEGEKGQDYDSDMTGNPDSPQDFDIEAIYIEGCKHNILELINENEIKELL